MKKTKTLHKVLSLCLVFALCAALALVLSACGKPQQATVDYVREEGVSAEDYFAKVLKQNASAREKFTAAARGEVAEPLYDYAASALFNLGVPVKKGVFGADMKICQHNDGPVTILLEI